MTLITIDKATEDLQARIDGEFSIKGVDECEDMKLGAEALELIKAHPADSIELINFKLKCDGHT